MSRENKTMPPIKLDFYSSLYFLDYLLLLRRPDRKPQHCRSFMFREKAMHRIALACKGLTFTMELSSVFNRIHFLVELKHVSPDDRITMLQNITPGQMACIGEIARRIYHQTIPLLTQDVTYFNDRCLVLRILFSLRVSFR